MLRCHTCPPVGLFLRCHFRTSDRSEWEPSRADDWQLTTQSRETVFLPHNQCRASPPVSCHISDFDLYIVSLSPPCAYLLPLFNVSQYQPGLLAPSSNPSCAISKPSRTTSQASPSLPRLHPAQSLQLNRDNHLRVARPWPSLLQFKRRSTRSERRSSLCPPVDLDRS